MSLIFAWGFKFLLRMMIWYTCPLRHIATGQTRMKAQVSSISYIYPAVTPQMLSIVLEESKDIMNFDLYKEDIH